MAQYVEIDPNGFVVGLFNNRETSPAGPEGHSFYVMDPPMLFIPDGPTPSQRLKWVGEGLPLEWYETATIEQIQARAIAAIDREADASRLMVVGDAARIKEYERAEQQAVAFRDAGFAGEAPSCVACWATAKQWTAQQAAEDILAAAARWLDALDAIRALRLQAKEDVRRAVEASAIETIRTDFSATLKTMMQGV